MATIDYKQTRLALELKHKSPLIGCRFDPTGRFLFASAEDNTIQRYDLLTGAKTGLVGHTSWVRGLAFVANQLPGGVLASNEVRLAAATVSSALQAVAGFAAAA